MAIHMAIRGPRSLSTATKQAGHAWTRLDLCLRQAQSIEVGCRCPPGQTAKVMMTWHGGMTLMRVSDKSDLGWVRDHDDHGAKWNIGPCWSYWSVTDHRTFAEENEPWFSKEVQVASKHCKPMSLASKMIEARTTYPLKILWLFRRILAILH